MLFLPGLESGRLLGAQFGLLERSGGGGSGDKNLCPLSLPVRQLRRPAARFEPPVLHGWPARRKETFLADPCKNKLSPDANLLPRVPRRILAATDKKEPSDESLTIFSGVEAN
ncbi:hypothetical protein J6590_029653 [Homalodisca vitripennis]|nr:hypothetical protein J6590_029653 [Homalodisca vitripennis]